MRVKGGVGRPDGIGRARFGSLAVSLALFAVPAAAQSGGPLDAKDAGIARAAFKAADHGQWGEAEAMAAQAGDPLPLKILRWADDLRPEAGHSFDEIAQFVDQNPDWPLLSTLRLRAEDAIAGASDARLKAWFLTHKPVSGAAKLRQADLLADAGDAAGAAALVRDAWINGDYSPDEEARLLARYDSTLRLQDHIDRLDRLLWDGRGEEAKRLFPLVPEGWRIEAEARLKLAAEARDAGDWVAKVPDVRLDDPGLAYERMRWLRRKGDDDAAAKLMARQTELGRPQAWWPDRQVLARKLIEDGDPAEAYRIMEDHGLKDPGAVAEAEFTAGWIALRFLKRPAEALPHFERLSELARMPITQARGAYWAGRAADALGQKEAALAWYTKAALQTTTYYGQLAATMPGVLPPPVPSPEPKAGAAAQARFQATELVRAARILAQIDEPDRMKPFLYRLPDLAQTPEDFALVADFAEAIGRPDLGVAEAKKAAAAGVTLLRAGYPLAWVPRNAGTEQALLLALTRQESAFELRAVSPSGALGLMQLMPGTAAHVAKELGEGYSRDRLVTDGVYNVTLGQAYFDGLLATFNGSYVLSIAGYNAGPGRVQQWVDEFGDPRTPGVDAVDWVESIPYAETRNYVQRVLENLQVYRLRVGDKTLAFSLEADLRR